MNTITKEILNEQAVNMFATMVVRIIQKEY